MTVGGGGGGAPIVTEGDGDDGSCIGEGGSGGGAWVGGDDGGTWVGGDGGGAWVGGDGGGGGSQPACSSRDWVETVVQLEKWPVGGVLQLLVSQGWQEMKSIVDHVIDDITWPATPGRL